MHALVCIKQVPDTSELRLKGPTWRQRHRETVVIEGGFHRPQEAVGRLLGRLLEEDRFRKAVDRKQA